MKRDLKAIQIKLPRKRKKAYIKAKGIIEYFGMTIANEPLYEDKPFKSSTKYPEYGKFYRGKPTIKFNW